MCYGAENYMHYYQIIMSLVRIVQTKHYDRSMIILTEYESYQRLCANPNVFLVLDGRI